MSSLKFATAILLFVLPTTEAPADLKSQTVGTTHRFPQTVADWQTLLPSVKKALQLQFGKREVEGGYGVQIESVADITGDGMTVALVSFGESGAYTTQLTLMRMSYGKPAVARFKYENGKIGPMTFLQGASVMHGATVDLLPPEHAVFEHHHGYDGEKLQDCDGAAYTWNRQSKRFDYNPAQTKKLTEAKCRDLPKTPFR